MSSKFTQQSVILLSPHTDDRIRSLARKHDVSMAYALRVTLELGIVQAERLDHERFTLAGEAIEIAAMRSHRDCSGGWHPQD